LFVLSAVLQAGFDTHTSLAYLLGAFGLMGLGWACILGPSTVLGMTSVPAQISSVAMGSLMTLHNIGGGLGLAIGVGLYRRFAAADLAQTSGAGTASWVDAAVAQPEQGVVLLSQHLGQAPEILQGWVQQAFLHGYQAVMVFLALVLASALASVLLLLRRQNQAVESAEHAHG
jgi:hypothetical protein